MNLRDLQYIRSKITAGTSECCHDFAIVSFRVFTDQRQWKNLNYCLTCQKFILDFDEEWSRATIIPIYNMETEEQSLPHLEKLEERLNNLCESDPEMDWNLASYMLYYSTFDEDVKRRLEKK